jgi:acyl dehydratase
MTDLIPGRALAPRTVQARNTEAHLTGSVHDDEQARRLGYLGGLVPGVTLLAYLTPTLLDAFGAWWPQRGRLRARFRRPVYAGEELVVRAIVTANKAQQGGQEVTLACTIGGDGEDQRVEAEARCLLDGTLEESTPWRRRIPSASQPLAGDGLPALTAETLAPGQELAPLTYELSQSEALEWAAQRGDVHPWYYEASPFGGRPIVHPALFARDPFRLLRHNFTVGPLVHAASELAYQGVGWPGMSYTVYGYVEHVERRRGRPYFVLDTLTVDRDGREILRGRHTVAILAEERPPQGAGAR